MEIVVDLSRFIDFFTLPVDVILTRIIFYFGWIPLAFAFLYGAFRLWIFDRENKWGDENGQFTVLAIDIPKGNEQTPKAMENLLTYLAGAHSTNTLIDSYWNGKFQLCFSLEIIGVEGYTQFIIHTPVKAKNLVESGVYSQYPDAEITEINDYTDEFKHLRYPNDEYDVWGAEFLQDSNPAYPIKIYQDFEHSAGRTETQFKDPMASLMDMYSSLGKGENFWFQIIIQPIGFDWMDKLDEEASVILQEKKKVKQGIFGKFINFILDSLLYVMRSIGSSAEYEEGNNDSDNDDSLKMMNLKPKQKKQVEAIHDKTSKVGYNFKIRAVYLAKKDVMNLSKAVSGFVGFMKQFKVMDLNGFKPDLNITGTSTAYFFAKSNLIKKKNIIFDNYINRSITRGGKIGLLNVEELATVWHFPLEEVVKAPLIQKTPGKKASAPMSLPSASDAMVGDEMHEPIFLDEDVSPKKSLVDDINNKEIEGDGDEEIIEESLEDKGIASPPSNLPIG